jgi:beta-galactosidase
LQFPYGAVYFRKSNPPRGDWERDYAQASKNGINVFRHWFLWGSIEIAPGVFDWDDYDRQMDLAAKYGIKTVIAEYSHNIPEWLGVRYTDLLYRDNSDKIIHPKMGPSTGAGGFNAGLCLDKPASRELTANFLTRMAERYKNHPAFLGYDIWNESLFAENICYCKDTIKAYQNWLKVKYGDLKTLAYAWKKYSYTSFEEIRFPASLGFYPESADWLDFRRENFHNSIKWKIGIIRTVDPDGLMSAHGVVRTFKARETACCDDWDAAANVELYGFTWVAARNGNKPWQQFSAVDIIRSAARGKPFWHAEMQGGPLWMQPQLTGRPVEDGRIPDEKDIRIWNMISMAGGARGIFSPRYRPLLNGPLFGAYGFMGMDGSPTLRSQMASTIAKWTNAKAQKGLMESSPVKGQIGILYVPECSTVSYLLSLSGIENAFYRIMTGAWQGFFDNNIQADFVHIDDIDSTRALYFPYPVSLTRKHVEKLKNWIKQGGILIAEACPGYIGDNLEAGMVQPNNGLDELFGVKEKRVEFMPDILTDIIFDIFEINVGGEGFLQTYECTTGCPCAIYQG